MPPKVLSARVNWHNFNMNTLISGHCEKNIQGVVASLLPTATNRTSLSFIQFVYNFAKYENLIFSKYEDLIFSEKVVPQFSTLIKI
jgi:hypothetical protein